MLFVGHVHMQVEQAKDRSSAYEIVQPMNDHGAMCVVDRSTDEVFHVVEYDDRRLRRQLAEFGDGDSVLLTLNRVSGRGNVWEATRG